MTKTKPPETPYGHLPPVMRLLYIREPSRSGAWLADRLSEDAAVEVQLDVQTATAAMIRLREESFDEHLLEYPQYTRPAYIRPLPQWLGCERSRSTRYL